MTELAEKILESLKSGAILGVEFNEVEMLGEEPTRELLCQVYANTGNFLPSLSYMGTLTEQEIAEVLRTAGVTHIADDCAVDEDGKVNLSSTTIRFFIALEPSRVRWMSSPNTQPSNA